MPDPSTTPPQPPALLLRAASALWTQAKTVYLTGAFPAYGSPAWCGLPADSPQRLAAALDAAEHWRRHVAEQQRLDALAESDPEAWFREVTADANEEARRTLSRLRLSRVPTTNEMAARRRPQPSRPVTACPGWPPLAVPGRPGWWRHCIDGQQVDLPHREAPAPERKAAA
ncbi:DUF2742 domain-containing protein [Streptomyces sp. YGL11-2]|uniref:DUF2742 domain-containing protein n=1 Tax=Streptomyces sp. YGL11-2 TaxID=3414028 RepID=UPI003CE94933